MNDKLRKGEDNDVGKGKVGGSLDQSQKKHTKCAPKGHFSGGEWYKCRNVPGAFGGQTETSLHRS